MDITGLQQETLPPQALLPGTVCRSGRTPAEVEHDPAASGRSQASGVAGDPIELFTCLLQARFVQRGISSRNG